MGQIGPLHESGPGRVVVVYRLGDVQLERPWVSVERIDLGGDDPGQGFQTDPTLETSPHVAALGRPCGPDPGPVSFPGPKRTSRSGPGLADDHRPAECALDSRRTQRGSFQDRDRPFAPSRSDEPMVDPTNLDVEFLAQVTADVAHESRNRLAIDGGRG